MKLSQIGFGENALSAKVSAPDTIEILVPVDCCAPAAECIGDTIEAIAKLPNVVANATGILKVFIIIPNHGGKNKFIQKTSNLRLHLFCYCSFLLLS